MAPDARGPCRILPPDGPRSRQNPPTEQGDDLPHRQRSGSRAWPLQAAACIYRIALGPRAGQKVLSLQTVPRSAACHSFVKPPFLHSPGFPHTRSFTLDFIKIQACSTVWTVYRFVCSGVPRSATCGVSQTCHGMSLTRRRINFIGHSVHGGIPGSALGLREGIPTWIPRDALEGHSGGNRSTQ